MATTLRDTWHFCFWEHVRYAALGRPADPVHVPVRPLQDGETGFYAVWDHWLLDTLSSWQKQDESSCASPPGQCMQAPLPSHHPV